MLNLPRMTRWQILFQKETITLTLPFSQCCFKERLSFPHEILCSFSERSLKSGKIFFFGLFRSVRLYFSTFALFNFEKVNVFLVKKQQQQQLQHGKRANKA